MPILRGLSRHRAFTSIVLAIFGICMGANIVVFTIVHSIVIAPLHFLSPEELVTTDNSYTKAGAEHQGSSIPNYFELKEGIQAFSKVGAYQFTTGLIGGIDSPERVPMLYVTPSFFGVLGVKARMGRVFLEEEGRYGGKNNWNVVILSDGFWKKHYGGDPDVVGKSLEIEGVSRTIVGVMPAKFHFFSNDVSLWATMVFNDNQKAIGRRHANTIAIIERLRPGYSIAQAQAQVGVLNARVEKEDPNGKWASSQGFTTTVRGLQSSQVEGIRPALLLLQAGVLLLLFVGAVNLANLFMVRASSRAKEMALRQVLGASRLNVVMRFGCETTLLAFLGSVLGLGIAVVVLRSIETIGVNRLPLGSTIAVDWVVVVVALCSAVLMGLLLAVPSVMLTLKGSLAPALADESRSGTASRSAHRFRHALIVAQIALAFILLTAAGLLGLSLERTLMVQPGFNPQHLITAWVGLDWGRYKEARSRTAFADRWLDNLRSLPGVQYVGLGTSVPVVGEFGLMPMAVEGHELGPGAPQESHHFATIAGDYFTALGIPLLAGRSLKPADARDSNHVCVVDEDFAKHYSPKEDAIGFRVALAKTIDETAFKIVGIVGSVKQKGLVDKDKQGMVYVPSNSQYAPLRMATIVRSQLPPNLVVSEMRKALSNTDPMLPLEDVKTMDARIEDSLFFQRSMSSLAMILACVALMLAAIGVYGVMAFAVAQRQLEIGIRLALGARPTQITVQFLQIGCRLLVGGILFGILAAFFVGKTMETLLFDVSPYDPIIFSATAASLAIVVLLASVVPARRAAAVSVMTALRSY